MLSISQIATTQVLAHRKKAAYQTRARLWDEAAKILDDDDTSGIDKRILDGRVSIYEVGATVQQKMDECMSKRWEFTKSNGQKVVLWKVLERVMKWVNRFKEIGDVAIQYDPGHAALPWAAVRFVLQASVSSVETFGHMLDGVELTTRIIAIYAEVERTCIKGVSKLKTHLTNALVKLYAAVLAYLARASHYFGQSTGKRVLKGAFQSSMTSVTPWTDRINVAETEVSRLVELVQAEDQRNILNTIKSAVLKFQENTASSKVPKDERRRLVHRWLEAVTTVEVYQKAQLVRHNDTCNWIFERQEFQEWASVTNAIAKPKMFWVHGGPGFGKTVLCAKIIDNLVARGMLLVYFFCVADEEAKRQPYSILRSWIDQLVQVNDDALDMVYDIYKANEIRSPTPMELWKLFKMLAQAIRCTFVVDGFDECSTINKASSMHTTNGRSEFLDSLIKETKRTRARILIVSRDNEDIRAKLGMLSTQSTPMLFEYSVSVNDTKDDIHLCSTEMVNVKLGNKPEKLKTQLAAEAARRSDGMFLWLDLLSHELDPGENAKRLRSIVSEMPAEINKTYERDLEKVINLKPDLKERAVAILRWILFALRPLTVRELAEAIAMTVDGAEETYPEDDLPDMWEESFVDEQYVNSYIRRSCGSLVELRSNNTDQTLALKTVHFVHFSVKEYLLRSDALPAGQSRLEAICFPDGSREHNRLARLCLQYLCYDVFGEKEQIEDRRRIRVYPFLAYAARSWYTHALHNHRMSEDIMHYAQKLFNPATSNWILWSKVFEGELNFNDEEDINSLLTIDKDPKDLQTGWQDIQDNASNVEAKSKAGQAERDAHAEGSSSSATEESLQEMLSNKDPSPVYYASLLGLTDIIKALQSQGIDCNTPGGRFGFPLEAAVCNEQQETVVYLLQQGVEVNQRGGLYGSAIGAAACLGFDKILTILIEAGADPKCKDTDGRNPLHLACYSGALATAKILLGASSDLMEESDLGETPFYEAVESGDREVVSLLLDSGADVNCKDAEGTPAIQKATALGHQQVVEELIKRSADVNVPTSTGLTSLQEAVSRDNLAIALILLAHTADIDAQDKDGWSALHFAIASGASAPAQCLIERGAQVNLSTNEGWTPLHIAAEDGNDEILKLLIDRGAEVDAENSSSYTSLFSAVWAGKLGCVEVLLAHGADVSQVNIKGETVLDEAIQCGNKEITQCLLDHNALHDLTDDHHTAHVPHTHAQNRSLSTNISRALFNEDQDQAFQLITGGDSQSQSVLDNALLSASLFGATAIAETVLNRRANLAATTYSKRTPLHLAAHHGFHGLVKTFIERGANISASDIIGSTPLDLAVAGGLPNGEAAKILFQNGALVQNLGPVTDTETITALEGYWKGTYTYSSWNKGVTDATALTVSFAKEPTKHGLRFWTCTESDAAGNFEIMGHLLTGNVVRFVKMYEPVGWLYEGIFDIDTMAILGTWGSNTTVRHGSFEMRKR